MPAIHKKSLVWLLLTFSTSVWTKQNFICITDIDDTWQVAQSQTLALRQGALRSCLQWLGLQ
jgi:hypothetical protein